MLINKWINVNKWYLIVKCYQFIKQIYIFGTQNEMTDRNTLSPFNKLNEKVTEGHNILPNISFCKAYG